MLLYLMRHGEAEIRAATDSVRSLTARGRNGNASVAKQFAARKPQIEMAFCSPYLRAQQTAEDIATELSGIQFNECELLAPETDPQELLVFLEQQCIETNNAQPAMEVLMVGHNPLLSILTGYLLGASGSLDRNLDTSNLVCLDVEVLASACSHLNYWLSPS